MSATVRLLIGGIPVEVPVVKGTAAYTSAVTAGYEGTEDEFNYLVAHALLNASYIPSTEDPDKSIQDILTELRDLVVEKTGYGIKSGLAVTAKDPADLTLSVSAGVNFLANGTRQEIAAVASLAVTAADETNPRVDIVYLTAAGVVTYLAGTPAAENAAAPATPEGGRLLAEVSVPANDTAIAANQITDKRTWTSPTVI